MTTQKDPTDDDRTTMSNSTSVVTDTQFLNRDIENAIPTTIPNTTTTTTTENQEILQSWNIAEQELLHRQEADIIQQQIQEERYPTRHTIHHMMLFVQCITCCIAFAMFIGQIFGLFIFVSYGPIQYVLHFYVFLMCLVVIVIETECSMDCFHRSNCFLFGCCCFCNTNRRRHPSHQQQQQQQSHVQSSILFRYWSIRGMFYTLIGVIGLEENDTTSDWNPTNVIENFIKIIAWCMIGCGILYILLGICCIQYIYQKERADYEQRCYHAQQLRRNGGFPTSTGSTTAVRR